MRRDLPYFTTLAALLRLAERQAAEGVALCPQSLAALAAFAEASNAAPRKLPPGRWAAVFRGCLAALGWPGERSLSSHEFQARRAFGEVLDGFGRFDALLGPLNFSEAVRRLGQLCRQRLFQPETRGRPAIQVLGVLESAGLSFDGLWVMGMNDDQWPPPPRPIRCCPPRCCVRRGPATPAPRSNSISPAASTPVWRRPRRKCGFPMPGPMATACCGPVRCSPACRWPSRWRPHRPRWRRQEAVAGRGRRGDRRCPGPARGPRREGFRRQLAAARPGHLPGLGLLPVPAGWRGDGGAGRRPRSGGARHAGACGAGGLVERVALFRSAGGAVRCGAPGCHCRGGRPAPCRASRWIAG